LSATVQEMTKVMTDYRKSGMRFRLVPKIIDLGWPWSAKMHSGTEKMGLLQRKAQIWIKTDLYYQRQKS